MNKTDPTRTITNREPGTASRRAGAARNWLIGLSSLCLVTFGCAPAAIQIPPPVPGAAPVAPPPPPAPYNGPTIPKLLGIPECAAATKTCAEKVCTCLKRQFPGPGAEFPNLGEVGPNSAPAVKCAADIIAAEAEAPQKVDALRYLGRVGCTKCYPCVEEGLLAALDDCTEVVRFEAAKAIRATAAEQCKCCQCTSCCTQKIYDKLYKVAYETNSQGCPVECSTRVRRMARQALCMCGGPMASEEPEEPTPTEGPSGVPPTAPPAIPPPATMPPPTPPATASAAATEKPIELTKPSQSPPTGAANVAEKSVIPGKSATPATGESTTSAANPAPAATENKADKAAQKNSAREAAASASGPILRIATQPALPPAARTGRASSASPLEKGQGGFPPSDSATPRPSPRILDSATGAGASAGKPSQTIEPTSMRLVEPASSTRCKACGTGGSTKPRSSNRFRYSWQAPGADQSPPTVVK